MENKEIIELLKSKNLDDLNEIKCALFKIKRDRENMFLQSLKDGAVKTFKEILNLGVEFNNEDLWSDIYRIEVPKINKDMFKDMLNAIFEANFKYKYEDKKIKRNILPKFLELQNSFRANGFVEEECNPIAALQYMVKYKIERDLKYGTFSQDLFEIGYELLGEDKLIEISKQMLPNFASKMKIKDGYEKVHYFIKKNGLIQYLLNGVSNEENMEYFLSVPEYKSFFHAQLQKEDKDKLMWEAVRTADFGKIKVLHDLGVNLPKDKQSYSEMFSRTQQIAYEAQCYIIQNVEDIVTGEQVILRTVLHDKYGANSSDRRINLVQQILERYSEEQIDLLPKAIEKRPETNEVNFVKNFYPFRT